MREPVGVFDGVEDPGGVDLGRILLGTRTAVVRVKSTRYDELQKRRIEANGFVTTEKDAVKLTPILRDHLETVGPIVIARLNVELVDEQESLSQLVTMVSRLDRRRR